MPFDRRLGAAAVAISATAAATPIPLAQLDLAGLVDAFHLHAGDTPAAVLTLAALGGILTIVVLLVALGGAALTLAGSPRARGVLAAAALGGLLTAPPVWLPTAALLGMAAWLVDRPQAGATQPGARAG